MKDIKEITKNFKTFTDWIYQEITAGKDQDILPDDQALIIDEEGEKLIEAKGVDMIMAKASKISSLNILHKDVNFKIFENLPKVWSLYQNAAEASLKQRVEA